MSRLGSRIRDLEDRLGHCPTCVRRPPLTEMVCPSRRWIPGNDTDTGPCPDCGQPRELIRLLWKFDLPGAEAGGE